MDTQNTTKVIMCCLFLLVITFPIMGFSDGVLYKSTKDSPYLAMVNETSQVAYINYLDGIQHMIISVVADIEPGKERDIKDMVWIFPIPAKPEDIGIDVIKDFKMFHRGIYVEAKVKKDWLYWVCLTLSSQIFPAPLGIMYMSLFGTRGDESGLSGILPDGSITEYMSVNKMGLSTKVITAKDGNALYNYIKERGADIPESAKGTFQAYIGKDYSFVISWVENLDEYIKNLGNINKKTGYFDHALQVYAKFKTDEIYYPMLLTSLYGEKIISVSLYFAEPVIFSSGDNGKIDYFYLKNKHKVPSEHISFYGGKEYYGNCVYSRYNRINDFAGNMRNDLWFKIGKPENLDRNVFFIRYFWILFILCYILCSAISSFLAGHIVFVKERKLSNKELFGLGLFNCLTLIGLVLAGNRMFKKKIPIELTEANSELNKEELVVSIKSRRKFYIWFSFIFMFFMLCSAFVLRQFLF